jgi:hypothetical protein
MPECYQDHGGVTMPMPIFSGRLHDPFDLALGEVLAGAIFDIRQPTKRNCSLYSHPANQTRNMLAAIFAIARSVVPLSAAQAQTAQQRLQAIFAMSPEEMAATSAFTRRAYEAQIAQIYRIQNKQIREIVLELVRNPVATAFGQKSSQSWLASPGSGWKSHHAYPGGLAVHTME